MNEVIKKVGAIVFCFCVLFSVKSSLAQSPERQLEEQAQEAAQAYQEGNYAQAFENWQKLAEQGVQNAALWTNLGLVAWQQGLQGQALRYFLKAIQQTPRDAQLQHNLAIVQEALGQNQEGQIPLLKLPWWRLSLSYGETLAVAAVFSAIFFFYLLWHLAKGKKQKTFFGYTLAFFWLVSLALWGIQVWKVLPKRAVVIAREATLLGAPTLEAPLGESLAEGQMVKIERSQGDFRLVKTSEGREVWVAYQELGEI